MMGAGTADSVPLFRRRSACSRSLSITAICPFTNAKASYERSSISSPFLRSASSCRVGGAGFRISGSRAVAPGARPGRPHPEAGWPAAGRRRAGWRHCLALRGLARPAWWPIPRDPQVLEFADGAAACTEPSKRSTACTATCVGAAPTLLLLWRPSPRATSAGSPSPKFKRTLLGRATVKFTGGDWVVADVLEMVDRDLQIQLPGEGAHLRGSQPGPGGSYFSKAVPLPNATTGRPAFPAGISRRRLEPIAAARCTCRCPQHDRARFRSVAGQGGLLVGDRSGLDRRRLHRDSARQRPARSWAQSKGAVQIQFINAQLRAVAQVDGGHENFRLRPGTRHAQSAGIEFRRNPALSRSQVHLRPA